MPRQTRLPEALKRFGLKPKLVTGWETRGSASFNPKGSVGHHTAGPKTGDRPSLNICVNGRPGLNGPLCNTFLPRGLTVSEQVIYVVAAGRANHAGLGGFRDLVGNSSVFGTEAEDDGRDGLWTPWQMWAFPRVMAAQLWLAGRDQTWYCSHRTWAPSRKIDPEGITDLWMKTQITKAFANPSGKTTVKKPPVVKPASPPKAPVEVPVAKIFEERIELGPFASRVLPTKEGPVTSHKAADLLKWSAAHSSEADRLSKENNLLLRELFKAQALPLPSGVDQA